MPDDGKRSTSTEKHEKTQEERGVQDLKCYHGVMNKEEVKQLMSNVFVGFFLIRSCFLKSKVALGLILSVRVSAGDTDACIHHYIIDMRGSEYVLVQELKDPDGTVTSLESKPFVSVEKLIAYYTIHRLACKVRLYQPICRPSWQLSHAEIRWLENGKLGTGSTCVVYRGYLRTRTKGKEREMAIKMWREEETTSEALMEARNQLFAEARIMINYKHPNVVRFCGLACERPPFMVCMELCVGGSLEEALRKYGKEMEDFEKQMFLLDAARGMRYLHTQKCVHRDLASRNCLISGNGIIKIGDFGLSKTLKKHQKAIREKRKEAPNTQAPETIQKFEFSQKTDVWSFGVLIYEVYFNGANLFADEENAAILRKIKKARMPTIESQTKLTKMHELLNVIWVLKPTDRPDFQKILELLVEALVPIELNDLKRMHINKLKGVNRVELPSTDVEIELVSQEEVKKEESPPSKEKVRMSMEKVKLSKESKDASTKREKRRKTSKEGTVL